MAYLDVSCRLPAWSTTQPFNCVADRTLAIHSYPRDDAGEPDRVEVVVNDESVIVEAALLEQAIRTAKGTG